MWLFTLSGPSLAGGFFAQAPGCGDMACWRGFRDNLGFFCPIRGRGFSRLRGGPQGSCTSTSWDALPRSGPPFRETITQWDSAQNGYFDVPGIIGNTFQRRVFLKCIEWERTGSIQFQFHSWSILQLPFRRVPYTARYDPPICQTANCCYFVFFFFFFVWCVKVRGIFVFSFFATCSFRQISLCNLLLFSPDLFSFFLLLFFFFFFTLSQKLHSGFIILSSRSQRGIAQTLRTGSFFTGWLPSSPAGCVTTNGGYVTDSRRTRVLALETRCVRVCGGVCVCVDGVFVQVFESRSACAGVHEQVITLCTRHWKHVSVHTLPTRFLTASCRSAESFAIQ